MKTKPKIRNSECMLTVRLSKPMLVSITKTAKNVALTRSDFVRTIMQKYLDAHPLTYIVTK